MPHANPGLHHHRVGAFDITAINDGQFDADLAYVVGLPAEDGAALLRESFRVQPPRITVSCFLLQFGGRKVLVDGGAGTAMGPGNGHAMEKLGALGVAAAEIDTVLLTHAHPDHLSGLLDAAGNAAFPNAELVLHEAEADFWVGAQNEARALDHAKDGVAAARHGLAAYASRTRRIADGAEVLPGVTARHLPGHTPGHTGWFIASGDASLLIWGDVVHLPGIQFARPEAGLAFDVDAALARATRERTFAMAATDRLLVAGMHLDFPTFGHVRRAGPGYAFEPLVWAPTATGLLAAG